MNLYRLSTLILTLFVCLSINAQDRHYTLFNYSPILLNPASAGAFEGTARIGGIFRDQSPTMNNLYTSPSFYIDAPLLNVRKRDWVGLGISFYSDDAGPFLSSSVFHIAGAYHLALDKKRKNVLSVGVSGGTINHRFDQDRGGEAIWGDFDSSSSSGVGSGIDGLTFENPASMLDINAGINLKAQMNKATNINIGFSINHLFKVDSTNISLFQEGTRNYRLPTLFTLHGEYNVDLNKQWIMSPAFIFQRVANQNEGAIQVLLGYRLLKREIRDNGKKGKLLKDPEAPVLRFGLGYRLADAAQVLLGYHWKDFKVGISYDYTTSGLRDANGGNGSFEVGASYIIKIFKKPEVDPVILCPKF